MTRTLTALRSRLTAPLPPLAAMVLLAVLASVLPALVPTADASEPVATTTTTTTTAGAPAATTPAEAPQPAPAGSAPSASPAPVEGTGAGTASEPAVQEQHLQHLTRPHRSTRGRRHGKGRSRVGAATPAQGTGGGSQAGQRRNGHKAPSPSTLTPALPPGLGSVGGVSGFFVESFQIPPFLLPIYQAAGSAYDIPWEVLAAINEIETDYGRDLSVSSAGAEGWMQFLPSSWAQYGVDANGDGYRDPYNPADAIFAAARYLRAAGGAQNIKAAIFSYNHSQAYVSSVMLRAQLLAGTPAELLDAVTGLTDARFPVFAPSHYSDGFQTVTLDGHPQTLAGTTIYSQPGAPVVAVKDGEVLGVGDSPTLGRYVALRDGYGNVYTYAQLGSVASLYPVLQPRVHGHAGAAKAAPAAAQLPKPSGPATAGVQPRSPLSPGAIVSGLALGAAAALEAPPPLAPGPVSGRGHAFQTEGPRARARARARAVRVFAAGQNDVYLHALRAGVQVLAGTVLGHVATSSATGGEPHVLFQIRPAGAGAPTIDPKPILDGWVALQNTSTFRAKGGNPFPVRSPSAGQVLLESERQLERQVGGDRHIRMRACERRDAVSGHDDRRVLATLELLSASGLRATVTGLPCGAASPATEGNARAGVGAAVKIVALDGVPVAGHQGSGSLAAAAVGKLVGLQGVNRPQRIVSLVARPGAKIAVRRRSAGGYVEVVFGPLHAAGTGARAGGAPAAVAAAAVGAGGGLSPREWARLIARLGEIPDPTVAGGPSAAALPDTAGQAGTSGAGEGGAGGDH